VSFIQPSLFYIGAIFVITGSVVMMAVSLVLYLRRRGESSKVLKAHLDELRLVSNAARAIAAAKLDEDELFALVHEQVSRFVDASTFQIGIFEGKYYIPRLRMVRGEKLPLLPFDLSESGGIFGYLRESGRWLLVRDFEAEKDMLPARPRYISDNPPKSAVFVPLVTVNGVIGGMAIQSDRVAAYAESDARLLSIIANQAASAIQNARALADERERARQFALVSEVATDTALILDLNQLLPRLIEAMQQAFGYYFIGIFLVEPDGESVVCRASTSKVHLVNTRMKRGVGLIGESIASQKIVVAPDVDNDPYYLAEPILPDTKSEAAVPLVIAGKSIGTLDLQSTKLNAFDESDMQFLEILGQQVAVAIGDARLYEAEREQAWQNRALLQVAEVSSQADDLDDAVTAVASIVPKLGGVAMCAILTTDERAEQFVIAALEGSLSHHEDLGVGDSLLLRDVPALQDMLATGKAMMGQERGRLSEPVLALPLMVQTKLLGAMLVSHINEDEFTPRQIELLTGLANQTSLVMESVQSRMAQQDEAWVTAALLQVAQAVNESEELGTLSETVVRLTPLLVDVDACAVFVREKQDTALRALRGYGFSDRAQAVIADNDFPVAAWRDWVLAKDAEFVPHQPELEAVPARVAEKLGCRRCAVLPLLTKSQLVGAMVIGVHNVRALPKERSFRILLGIAQQTAAAVESARLQIESLERQRLEQELNFARDIQKSFLPKEIPQVAGWGLAAAWEAARQVGGDFYDVIAVQDGTYALAIADVADKGVPAALFMAMSRTLLRSAALEGHAPAPLLNRVNRIIQNDSNTDLFVTVFCAKWHPATGEVVFANAGHNPPLVFRHGIGPAASACPIEQLPMRGIALGVLEHVQMQDEQLLLNPGDVLLLYTDGIIDALNAENDEFGMERLQQVFMRVATQPAHVIASAIMAAVDEFAGAELPFDDQTLLVLKRETG
jgi:serine phosphatase RsbU (regulator of sigma subunit)/putative methionine-R-sulfoxide reductase with GAF domain